MALGTPTRQVLLAPLSRRIALFRFCPGVRAAKPAALTPGYDSFGRFAAPVPHTVPWHPERNANEGREATA